MSIQLVLSHLKRIAFIGIAAVVFFSGFSVSFVDPAQANQAASAVASRAERELDRVAGAGTADQIQGRAKEDLGRVQRQFDSETEGAVRQAKGKAQKDIGRTKEAAEDAAAAVEESGNDLVDSVKDFFD